MTREEQVRTQGNIPWVDLEPAQRQVWLDRYPDHDERWVSYLHDTVMAAPPVTATQRNTLRRILGAGKAPCGEPQETDRGRQRRPHAPQERAL